MTPEQITADVDRGLAIVAELEHLKKELKTIEARLEAAGLEGDTIPLEEAEREGRQFIAIGTTHRLPVVFESDQLIGSFPSDSPLHVYLRERAGDKLEILFREKRVFERIPKDGLDYRRAVRSHFEPAIAEDIIAKTLNRDKAGIPRSRTVIAWDRAAALS